MNRGGVVKTSDCDFMGTLPGWHATINVVYQQSQVFFYQWWWSRMLCTCINPAVSQCKCVCFRFIEISYHNLWSTKTYFSVFIWSEFCSCFYVNYLGMSKILAMKQVLCGPVAIYTAGGFFSNDLEWMLSLGDLSYSRINLHKHMYKIAKIGKMSLGLHTFHTFDHLVKKVIDHTNSWKKV